MLQFDLTAEVRNTFGKGASHRLRNSGGIPAILYGNKTEALSLQMNTKEFTTTMLKVQRRNAVFNLHVKNGQADNCYHVMVREIQTEPVSDAPMHADFCAIDLERPLVFTVPLVYTGKAKGVELGGDMTIFLRSVVLKGRPLDIPEVIEVDITELGVDAKMTCADLAIPANVQLVGNIDTLCVSVVMPVRVAAAAPEPAKKGKKK